MGETHYQANYLQVYLCQCIYCIMDIPDLKVNELGVIQRVDVPAENVDAYLLARDCILRLRNEINNINYESVGLGLMWWS